MKEIRINLPTLHVDQRRAFFTPGRFLALRCGRRWGKTLFGVTLTADVALKGWPIGWFAPEFKFINEPYKDLIHVLGSAVKSSSETKGQIQLWGGGIVDVWSLDNPLAGRGRKYKLVIIDEAAFGKPLMVEQWRRNIRPTLVDYQGFAIVMSNTNGEDQDQFFWQIANEDKLDEKKRQGFIEYHAPSSANPYLPVEELEGLRASSHPLVWRQEYEAEFVNWAGVAFFSMDKLLFGGEPVEWPNVCEGVYAVIDSAVKTGRDNDGTGVAFYAYDRHAIVQYQLVVLDWDYVQIEGATLATWLPSIFERGEFLAKSCKARHGFIGTFIEDKVSGTIMLQHARTRGWPAHPIDSKLTQMGKQERAINASGPVFMDKVKLSRHAHDKVVNYKGSTRNHLVTQITGFQVGIDMVDDDLLDCFSYGVMLSLGNHAGF